MSGKATKKKPTRRGKPHVEYVTKAEHAELLARVQSMEFRIQRLELELARRQTPAPRPYEPPRPWYRTYPSLPPRIRVGG